MTRATEIAAGIKVLKLPAFFASISSVKTNFPPTDYLNFLERFGFPNYLLSAYDVMLLNKKLNPTAEFFNHADHFILLDSGNYEAFWQHDRLWTLASYHKAIESTYADLVFEFDDPWHPSDDSWPLHNDGYKTVPIVHGNPDSLPQKVSRVARLLGPLLIAVPERELGDGIVQRTLTLHEIRAQLDKEGHDISIHLLGTGNPLSILLYAAYGADSFDGLEWCQTTVDQNTGQLLHFSQRELFKCDCEACTADRSYSAVTLGHNLLFYLRWMRTIRTYIRAGEIHELIQRYLPLGLLDNVHRIING